MKQKKNSGKHYISQIVHPKDAFARNRESKDNLSALRGINMLTGSPTRNLLNSLIDINMNSKKSNISSSNSSVGLGEDFRSPNRPEGSINRSYLIGWNLDNFKCLIAFTLDSQKYKIKEVEIALAIAIKELGESLSPCRSSPIILGELIPNCPSSYSPSAEMQANSIWITLTEANSTSNNNSPNNAGNHSSGSGYSPEPQLHSLYSLGNKYNTSCYMISYDPVNTDDLFCLQLDSDDKHSNGDDNEQSDMHVMISQINASRDLKITVMHYLEVLRSNSSIVDILTNSSKLNFTIEVYEQRDFGSSAERDALKGYKKDIYAGIFSMLGYYTVRMLQFVMTLLENKAIYFLSGPTLAYWVGLKGKEHGDSSFNGVSLCELSLFASHLRERLRRLTQILYECNDFGSLWFYASAIERYRIWKRIITFLLLILVDSVLGWTFGLLLWRYKYEIINQIAQSVSSAQQDYIIKVMQWFNSYPLGVKLNPIITYKIGKAIGWCIRIASHWHTQLSFVRLPLVVFIACMGVMGFTTQVMLSIDVLRLLTLHVATIHRLLSIQQNMQLQLLYSLFYLFMGKKKNILRMRIDSCEYDPNQLLFGIVLCVIVTFLFPSFAVFFYMFALVQLIIVIIQFSIWVIVVFIKDFPYYDVVNILLKRTSSLSGGVSIDIDNRHSSDMSMISRRPVILNNRMGLHRMASSKPTNITTESTSAPKSHRNKHSIETGKRISFKDEPEVFELSANPGDDNVSLNRNGPGNSAGNPAENMGNNLSSNSNDSTSSTGLLPSGVNRPSSIHSIGSSIRRGSKDLLQRLLFSAPSSIPESDTGEIDSERSPLLENVSTDASSVDDLNEFEDALEDDPNQQSAADLSSPVSSNAEMSFASEKSESTSISSPRSASSDGLLDTMALVSSSPKSLKVGKHHSYVHLSEPELRTTFFSLRAQEISKLYLLRNFAPYWHYLIDERDILWSLAQGVLTGRPPLDIQLIRATCEVSERSLSAWNHSIRRLIEHSKVEDGRDAVSSSLLQDHVKKHIAQRISSSMENNQNIEKRRYNDAVQKLYAFTKGERTPSINSVTLQIRYCKEPLTQTNQEQSFGANREKEGAASQSHLVEEADMLETFSQQIPCRGLLDSQRKRICNVFRLIVIMYVLLFVTISLSSVGFVAFIITQMLPKLLT